MYAIRSYYVPYASAAALQTAEAIMSFIRQESVAASEELARERGPCPAFAGSPRQLAGGAPMRNAIV